MESLVPWAETRDSKKPRPPRAWQEGEVDSAEEHIELRTGNAQSSGYDDWAPVARLRRVTVDTYVVQWLLDADTPDREVMIAGVRRELDFYLIELDKVDPWMYAIYHCTTASNMYSSVQWSYFPEAQAGERHASKVVRLPEGGAGILSGNELPPRPKRKTREG